MISLLFNLEIQWESFPRTPWPWNKSFPAFKGCITVNMLFSECTRLFCYLLLSTYSLYPHSSKISWCKYLVNHHNIVKISISGQNIVIFDSACITQLYSPATFILLVWGIQLATLRSQAHPSNAILYCIFIYLYPLYEG